MDIHATYTFNAPAQAVWDLLMDTERIAACIPGCDRLEPLGDNRYRARLTVSLAAVSGAFDGTVAMVDQQPPSSYRLIVEGQGRGGFVKGASTIVLTSAVRRELRLAWANAGSTATWAICPRPTTA